MLICLHKINYLRKLKPFVFHFIEGFSGVLEQMKERDLNANLSWDQIHQTTPASRRACDKKMHTHKDQTPCYQK